MNDRLPPHSEPAEVTVLGAAMLSDEAFWRASFLAPEDFYQGKHRKIWTAMRALSLDPDEPITEVSVAYELNRRGHLEEVGGPAYLARLVADCIETATVDHYARVIQAHARNRRAISLATALVGDAYAGRDLAPHVEALAALLTDSRQTRGPRSVSDLLDSYAALLDTFEDDPAALRGLQTGIRSLDQATRGLQLGELTIIGASTSVGKSQFALTVAKQVALHEGGVLFFSLEMSDYSLLERLIAQAAAVNVNGVINWGWTPNELARWKQWRRELRPLPLYVDDCPTLDTSLIRARLHQHKVRYPNTCLAVIDYLDVIYDKGENEPLRRGEITRAVRAMAQEFDVHVLMLCQLNRGPEVANRRPTRADLKWSNQIAEIADNVILLHKPGQDESKLPTAFTVIIDKQRRGPCTSFDISFVRETGQIGEKAHESIG